MWRNAPSIILFDRFKVGQVFTGRPIKRDAEKGGAHSFRTMIREGATKGPNLVDRFAVVQWGCGRDRIEAVIVDEKEEFFFPSF